MPIFGTNSSINASGYGFLGSRERTIESTISPRNLTEGTQITVSVTTNGYEDGTYYYTCLLYTSPSPRDKRQSRMPSSA